MTTNPTIEGVLVSRELIERVTNPFGDVHDKFNAVQELRALLDAPVCKTCGDTGWVPEPFSLLENMLECPDCKPAAQPHGEPVAYRWRVKGHGEWTASVCKVEFDARANDDRFVAQALYAEHPAPVAVVLPERRAVSPSSRDQAMCANTWNACLDELKRLNPSL